MGELGEALLQTTNFQIGFVDMFPADGSESGGMIALGAIVIVVPLPGFVASLAYAAPDAAHRFVLSGARKFHLIHGVLLAKKPAALPTVDATVGSAQPLPAYRLATGIGVCV